ncbi:outer membrane efflux protein [Sphingobacterium spiritivorum ATCC 33300]|uniref:Outer membrane efflux protein n=2 Tax=Sphingobacterium spiritivorum TaxID=258 RepID=C2G4K1_SPHSI|nr:outer membrane efflux protein [Sphingobacterium spiritivorum ATCC 33300]QQS94854.1 TolC family protein [Sphingobacterium spiritivorum]
MYILNINMNRISKLLMVLLSIGILGSAHAQEELTLKEAIQYALQNKADAKKSKLDVINAENKISEVRSNALPQINLSAGLTYNPIIQKIALPDFTGQTGGTTLVEMGQKWQATPTVSLTQQIFNQSVFTGLKAANTTRAFYQVNHEMTEEQLIERVANSYYDVYQAKMQLETIESNLKSTRKTRDVIFGSYSNGLAKKIDLDRTDVAVNNLESSKLQKMNEIQLKENALKFVIGMDVNKDIQMPKSTFNIDLKIANLDTAQLDNRTEIKLLATQRELNVFNKKSIEAQYYPTLSLQASYGYAGFGQKFPLVNNNGVWANFASIGVNLSFPIFNGFSTRSKVRQAQIDIDKLDVDISDKKLSLMTDANNAQKQLKNSLLNINMQQANMELAKEVLSNVENNYKNGLATLTDLLDAEKAYAEAQNNHSTALLNYKVAEIQIIKSNGNLKSLINE